MDNFKNISGPSLKGGNYDIAIIGGGPAGIMAAISAKRHHKDANVVILEKNNKLGKKLLLTGNGRCNFTTNVDQEELINSFGKKSRFFIEAFNAFSNKDLIEFFKSREVLPQYEHDNKVFPKDGNSLTILNCLKKELADNNVNIIYDFIVQTINKFQDPKDSRTNKKEIFTILSTVNKHIHSNKVILATGGLSYPQTGSSGDGYELARSLGHNIVQPSPSIIPITSRYLSSFVLQGISLKNVELSVISDKKTIKKVTGDIIFTHFGISGPAANSIGNIIFCELNKGRDLSCLIDLCPELTIESFLKKYEQLRIVNSKKEISTIIKIILGNIPNELILKIFDFLKIDIHLKTGNTGKKDLLKIINFTKNFIFKVEGTLPISEAIVTEGGVPVKEVYSKTMESKVVKNLYLAGEIIELQGPEGGFNLQKAFSTGWLAGKMAALDLNITYY